jgi:hypothetical protein
MFVSTRKQLKHKTKPIKTIRENHSEYLFLLADQTSYQSSIQAHQKVTVAPKALLLSFLNKAGIALPFLHNIRIRRKKEAYGKIK